MRVAVLVVLAAGALAASSAADASRSSAGRVASPLISIRSGAKWYWSTSLAEAFFGYQRVSRTAFIYSGTCSGLGASVPSQLVDVNLFNRFRCKITGASFKRRPYFDKVLAEAGAAVAQAPADANGDKPQAVLDAFDKAAQRDAQYRQQGDPSTFTVVIGVTGRRSYVIE